MAHFRGYRFLNSKTKRLASLAGADFDLRTVVDFCKRLESLLEIKNPDFVLYDALSSAAVIRYGRCFKKGIRDRLFAETLTNSPTQLLETHEYIIALRDKHIAHSVNPFEENDVTVQIADHFVSSREISSVNTAHGRAIGLSFEKPGQLHALADWWLAWLKTEMKKERRALVVLARTIPLEELKRNEQAVLGADTSPRTVGKRRPRP